MDIRQTISRVLLLSFLPIAAAQAQIVSTTDMASLVGEFDERYNTEVPVSGNVVAGLSMAGAPQTGFTPHVILPQVSTTGNGQICLSVVSQDGIYSAHNTYRLPAGPANNLVQIDYSKSKHKDFLDERSSGVAIKAQPGACGSESQSLFLLTAKGKAASEDKGLLLQVDSLGATDVVVAARGQDRKIIKGICKELVGERKTGFDYICTLPITHLQGETVIKIQRLKFGRKMPAVTLKVGA